MHCVELYVPTCVCAASFDKIIKINQNIIFNSMDPTWKRQVRGLWFFWIATHVKPATKSPGLVSVVQRNCWQHVGQIAATAPHTASDLELKVPLLRFRQGRLAVVFKVGHSGARIVCFS
jgi:hypothetical protein